MIEDWLNSIWTPIVALLLLVVGVFAVHYHVEKYGCSTIAQGMGVEYDFGFVTHCRIKIDGKLIPLRNYRVL